MTVALVSPSSNGWIGDLPRAAELAKGVAGTEFVPRSLRDNVAAIAACILYGAEVGLGPMQSLAKIAVIDGRPALTAEAQRALVYAAGHELWLEESTVTRCTWAGRRTGSDQTSRVTWTMDDARRAKLAGRPAWNTYPRAMLSARSSAELCRAMFADVIGGLAAVEELEDGLEIAGVAAPDPVTAVAGSTTRRRTRRGSETPPAVVATVSTGEPPAPDAPLPPLPGEPGQPPALMSEPQKRRMFALFRDRGYTGEGNRAARLAYAAAVIDRDELTSANELTADEASAVIRALEADADEIGGPDSERRPESDESGPPLPFEDEPA